MSLADEAAAVEYRRKMIARAAWECAQRYQAFPGTPVAAAAVSLAWEPITNPERSWDPPQLCAEPAEHAPTGVVRDGLQVA